MIDLAPPHHNAIPYVRYLFSKAVPQQPRFAPHLLFIFFISLIFLSFYFSFIAFNSFLFFFILSYSFFLIFYIKKIPLLPIGALRLN